VAALRRAGAFVGRSLRAPLDAVTGAPGAAAARGILWTLLDVVVAAVLYSVCVAALIDVNSPAGPYAQAPVVLHVLAAVTTLPVGVRRRRPAAAWLVTTLAMVVAWSSLAPALIGSVSSGTASLGALAPMAVAQLLCTYQLAASGSAAVGFGAWGWSVVGLAVIGDSVQGRYPQEPAIWVWAVVAVTLAAVLGGNLSARRRVQSALEEEQRRSTQEQAARVRLEERSRVARELHDVVAHNMSVIAIQAEAAPLRAHDDAAALARELADIRRTALETLTEMRRVLGVLRTTDEDTPTAPTPDLGQLDALIARVRATGANVELTTRGTPRPVAAGVGVSVYRIVQESLSNALRHAPGAPIRVVLTYDDPDPGLVVRVENDRSTVRPDDTGGAAGPAHGLLGMRERASLLGGSLTAGPTAAGGYAVEVHLPPEG
jgi:signal transduction histidine kinase